MTGLTGDETIKINDLTLCHKHSGPGLVRSTLPDVCKSPTTPVPYVNVAYARDLEDGTTTVFSHGGAMNGIKGSRFYPSYGDEPGTGGGVKSGVNMHEATWLSWSPNVFMEGKPVTRLTDKMHMNRRNTVSIGGYYTKWPQGSPQAYLCDVGCACYARHRPRSDILAAGENLFPGDDESSPGRYQNCVRRQIRSDYPRTVLGSSTIVGDDRTNTGFIPEVGFWDPNNPDNQYPSKPPGEVILEGADWEIPKVPRQAPWYGRGWFDVRGSRWMDVVRVDNGQMTHMWDMKFPGDRWPNEDRKNEAYQAIADKHGAEYEEFVVLDQCDNCETAVEDYERQRSAARDQILRDLADGLKRMPPILPRPGRMPPLPSPIR